MKISRLFYRKKVIKQITNEYEVRHWISVIGGLLAATIMITFFATLLILTANKSLAGLEKSSPEYLDNIWALNGIGMLAGIATLFVSGFVGLSLEVALQSALDNIKGNNSNIEK